MGNRSRYKTFILKIPFISSYDALTGSEPLNAAFLGHFHQISRHCLEPYSKTATLKGKMEKQRMDQSSSAIAVGGFMPL